jgi:hypothetical protein
MPEKKSVDLKPIVVNLINSFDKDQFMNLINLVNGTLSVDGKVLTNEELKAVTAFVRLMRENS